MKIDLTPSQFDFVYSRARHPAFVGGWSVGKTFVAIQRAILYAKGIPNNLGVIFRKTARSLHDSTLRDFESYTGKKVNADRNFTYPNGSTIMFRHLDEIDSINQQNLNLGFFYIEQGEELDSNREFFMLFGRLRRTVTPSEEFKKLGLPLRSGWVIANAGDHWMLPLWKEGELQRFVDDEVLTLLKEEGCDAFASLIESRTLDVENQRFLKPDFKASLKVLSQVNPVLYRQYAENDWTVSARNVVFNKGLIDHMYSREDMLSRHSANAGVVVDPSGEGADPVGFMAGRGGDVVEKHSETNMPPSQVAIHSVEMCKRINGYFIIVDCDGVGVASYQELMKLPESYLQGIQIIKFHGSAPSALKEGDRVVYKNKRTEAAFIAQKRGWRGQASVNPKDTALVEELKADEYELKNGILCLIPKDDIKKRLGRSPTNSDCWKMLQWGFEQEFEDKVIYEHRYRRERPEYAIADGVTPDDARMPQYAVT